MSDLIEKIAAGMNAKLEGTTLEKSIALAIADEGRVVADAEGARVSEDAADCELRMSKKTFEGLLTGDVNPMRAVMLGKIKIKGDMKAAMGLQKLLG